MTEVIKEHFFIKEDPQALNALRKIQQGLGGENHSTVVRVIEPESPIAKRVSRFRFDLVAPQGVIDSCRRDLDDMGLLNH